MPKKYIVRLSDTERHHLQEVIKKLQGSSQKVRRAQILFKADANGPGWTDQRIAEAYACRINTVEKIRQRFVEEGFERALEGQNASIRRPRGYWTGHRKRALSPRAWDRRRQAMRAGACGCWPGASWNWGL